MTYLLDTSAILAHYCNQKGADQVQAIFDDETNDVLIASVSLTEFSRRLSELRANSTEIVQILDAYCMLFAKIIAIDENIARIAIEIYQNLPKRLPMVDSLIAAAAKACNATLVYSDAHLSAIPAEWLVSHAL